MVFILGISLIPSPSPAGGRLYYTEHIITSIKSRPVQKQLPGPNKVQGSLISVPTCFWVPDAVTAGWGRGYGRRGATFARPIENRGTLHYPPSLKGGSSLEKTEPPRAGCPGRGRQHGAPRDAPVPLRAWCIPPMPLYSSSTRSAAMLGQPRPPARPAPPRAPPARSAALSFPPPAPACAAPERRRPALGGRSGWAPQDEAPPAQPDLPPPEVSVGRLSLAARGGRGTRCPHSLGGQAKLRRSRERRGVRGVRGACPHEEVCAAPPGELLVPAASALPWAPAAVSSVFGDLLEKPFQSPHRKE